MSAPAFDALVLAGGRGSRLGGVDKAAIELEGEPLVERVVRAAEGVGAGRVIVVGPDHAAPAGAVAVREEPPFSGPLAALAAGLERVRSERVLLLSCDLVDPRAVCRTLTAADYGDDGVMLVDDADRAQWLAGVYSAAGLRSGIAAVGGGLADRPLKLAFAGLSLRRVGASRETTADIDTPDDLLRAREARTARPGPTSSADIRRSSP